MKCAQTGDTMSGASIRGHRSGSSVEAAPIVAAFCGLRLSRRMKREGPRPQRLLNLALARSLWEPLGGTWVGVGFVGSVGYDLDRRVQFGLSRARLLGDRSTQSLVWRLFVWYRRWHSGN